MTEEQEACGFEQFGLKASILQALHLLKLEEPTPVQQQVIPLALRGQDVIAQARTGSGKTAAYAIPLCQMVAWEENKPQVLVLTPTRELAMQVQQDILDIGKLKRIKAVALYGKHSFRQQAQDLKQKSHIIVGTPGRVLDHLERGTLFAGAIGYLVLDEADEMFHMGFLEQVIQILDYLPIDRVTMLFSATMPKAIVRLAEQSLHAPVTVHVAEEPLEKQEIQHSYYDCGDTERLDVLLQVLKVRNPDSCIVFANMRATVEDVYHALWNDGFCCARLHGGMEQWERTEVMTDFKKGLFRYLVATDVAARGIDVDQISLVVNYELPPEREIYIHRVGRTGRAGAHGDAISLITPWELSDLRQIEALLQISIAPLPLPDTDTVQQAEYAFRAKMDEAPVRRENKNAALQAQVLKLQIGDGKKAKIRPVDIVGTICAIPGVEAMDIGVIHIMDWTSTVEILHGKGQLVLEMLQTKPIKAKVRKVIEARS